MCHRIYVYKLVGYFGNKFIKCDLTLFYIHFYYNLIKKITSIEVDSNIPLYHALDTDNIGIHMAMKKGIRLCLHLCLQFCVKI